MRLRSVLLLVSLACAACTQEPSPTAPSEALFLIDPGAGNREFTVVEITAQNAVHSIDPSTPLVAPYQIYLANAFGPVQGIIQPNEADSLQDIELLFGGETVPRVVTRPQDNSQPGCPLPMPTPSTTPAEPTPFPLCVNSGSAPDPMTPPGTTEVRFDVVTVPPQAFFNASVGGNNADFLIGNALSPATIYVEDVQEIAQGVFTKNGSQTSMTVTLLIDGVARNSATSPEGSNDQVVVQFQLD